ncbi:choice-of-anchor X domain-containing protein [Massilia niabensis]|uniref:Choice-of-anchor X domain-containing protein n=1 Tax=Massilia niabensis TaxID=544910 RepID=A0ABW0LC64_9BURK
MPSDRPSQGKRGRASGLPRWLPISLIVALLAAIGWLALKGDEPAPSAAPAAGAPSSQGPQFFGQVAGQMDPPVADERARRRQQLVEVFQLADHSYCSYREGSKYPASSRPMSQNPDQAYPNRPVTEVNPMRGEDRRSNPNILLQTSQSRVYLAAGESVAFSLRAVEPNGTVVPLVVTRSIAAGITRIGNGAGARPTTQVPLAFADDGSGADPVAGDGAFAAVLTPAQTGLAGFHGTIRTEVRYTAAGRNGVLVFDVIYSPKVPAVWAGAPREAVVDGSLAFILRVDVRQAGRYVITGRIDDARGTPFALATFNEVLGPGPNEVRLVAFGKLMHDGAPALPLTLRDVDGYLLKENTDPDRELMPRLEGPVMTSRTRSLEGIADDEWTSEERERYLTEFAKDRRQAHAELAKFDPAGPIPASSCGPVK